MFARLVLIAGDGLRDSAQAHRFVHPLVSVKHQALFVDRSGHLVEIGFLVAIAHAGDVLGDQLGADGVEVGERGELEVAVVVVEDPPSIFIWRG